MQCKTASYVHNTYSGHSNVSTMLQSISQKTLKSFRFNMYLCIIYKAQYNLAMFPLLDYATPAIIHTWGNNIKFILPHCSKGVFKHFPICYTQKMLCPISCQERLHPWTCPRPASQVLHTNTALNWVFFYQVLNILFSTSCLICHY